MHIVTGGLKHFRNVNGLTRVQVSGFGEKGNLDDALTGLENLNVPDLYFSTSLLTDKGLVHMKNIMALRRLTIHNTKGVTDAGLVHLRGLTNLQSLHFASSTRVTDQGKAELRKHLPNCKIN